MSSWSSMPAPPPRSERSRSPSRSAYGRPAYSDPYADPYRDHWDTYNRDRAWADYERDRGSYDHGRRGRSRSPPPDDTGRKRRRSASPYERERYDPRPRYEDYDGYRGHGHSPSRGRGHGYGSRSGRGVPPPDPHSMDYPATLKQFADWFRYNFPQQATEEDSADKAAEQEAGDGSKPRNGIRSRWEKYKKEFLAQQLQTLFDHHRKSPWFAEKYDPAPEFANLRSRVRKVGWRGRMKQFLNELEDGKFDPTASTNENETDASLKENDVSIAENGSAMKQEDASPAKEDDFGMGLDGDEEAADNAVDLRGETNGKVISEPDGRRAASIVSKDEVSVEPEGNQVMIRTIPPDIGRMKLEAAIKDIPGFLYLALGDPMQKRNYYRAGWIKFMEDSDMPKVLSTLGEKKIEGFKLHVTHNTRAFTSKVRFAPEVASRPDRIAKDLEQAKKLVSILEDEYERVRKFKMQKPAKDGSAEVAPIDGSTADRTDGDSLIQPEDDVLMTDALVEDEEPRERGSEAVERRIEKLISELPEPDVETEKQAYETKKNTIALDLYLAYLRTAFHTCYYCVSVSDNVEELQRKCIKHVRKPLSKTLAAEVAAQLELKTKAEGKDEGEINMEEGEGEEGEKEKEKERDKVKETTTKDKESRDWKRNDERWLDWLDNRIALLINRDSIDVRDYGGKRYEDELSKAVEPHVKQEDEGKYRCKSCSKLFKATSFVEKHILNKHAELVKSMEDIPYYNNFALDPQRIQPFTHYPQPVGTTQPPPPQAYGLQGPPQSYPEYARGVAPPVPSPFYGAYPPYPAFPPPIDPYGAYPAPGQYYAYAPPMPLPPRNLRDEPPLGAGRGGRLGDRIGGFAPGHEDLARSQGSPHGIEGLPAKPVGTLESGPARRNGRGPPPPPPPDAREDPRAAAGRKVSYHDMDLVAEGDVELQY